MRYSVPFAYREFTLFIEFIRIIIGISPLYYDEPFYKLHIQKKEQQSGMRYYVFCHKDETQQGTDLDL